MTDLAARYPNAHRFKFAEHGPRDLCEWLTGLALEGRKTGTCWPLKHLSETEPMLSPGDVVLYTDWDDRPVFAARITHVAIHSFEEVPESFALSEGENETLQGWRDDHRGYHERVGDWSDNMEMVCETFHVIERF